jgi:hypothetical protein
MAARGTLTYGPDFTPASVHHANGKLSWMVWEVLEHWSSPLSPSERLATGAIVERWRLEVSGPLPGQPERRGRFVLIAETRGNEPGWLLSPATP